MKNNETPSICSTCKGQCCKTYSGCVFPKDLKEGVTKETLIKMFKKGYQFDNWEGSTGDSSQGEKTGWFIRPQHTNSREKVIDRSWGGTCVFLTDKGCIHKFEDRPSMCKDLVPLDDKGKKCAGTSKYTKKAAAIAWLPYNDLIEEVINQLR